MSEYTELTAKIEALEERVKYLEDTFATLADMNKSGEMGQYIAQRQRALAASKLVNTAAGSQKLNADAQQQVIDQLAAEKAAMDARIEEAIRAAEQNAPAEDDLAEQFTYRAVPGGVEIQGFNGFEVGEELIIPNKIEDKDVVGIGEDAFKNIDIKRIRIPNCVTYIGNNAFKGCKNLISIRLPQELKKISESGFEGTGLTEITLPPNVTSLGYKCFEDCTKLKTVILNDKLETIESFAFSQTMISDIIIPKSVKIIKCYAFDWINGSVNIAFLGYNTKIEATIINSQKPIFYCLAGSEAQKAARMAGLSVKPLSEFRSV